MKVIRNKYVKLVLVFFLVFGVVSVTETGMSSYERYVATFSKDELIHFNVRRDVLGDFVSELEIEDEEEFQELAGVLTQDEINQLADTLALLEQFDSLEERTAIAKAPIETIARKMKISSHLLMRIAYKESRFIPGAVNKHSGATGLTQMTSRTWNYLIKTYGDKYGYASNTPRTDALASLLMCCEYILENKRIMTDRLKRPPTDQELYLAHALGTYGAIKLITKGEAAPHKKPSEFGVQGVIPNKGLFIKNGVELHYTAAISNILI